MSQYTLASSALQLHLDPDTGMIHLKIGSAELHGGCAVGVTLPGGKPITAAG